MEPVQIAMAIGGILIGAAAAYYFSQGGVKLSDESIKTEAKQMLSKAKAVGDHIRTDAKKKLHEIKQYAHEENQRMEAYIERLKESLKTKERQVQSRVDKTKQVQQLFTDGKKEILGMREEMKSNNLEVINILVQKTGVSKKEAIEEAGNELYNGIMARKDIYLKKRIEDAEENAVKLGRNILTNALQRYSDRSSVDRNSTSVIVKNEKSKLLLVGKNGENIDHLESKYDVEVIFNDYPKTITIGGFNLVNRQIVTQAVEILQKARTVTPKAIDEALLRAKKEVEQIMLEKAKNAIRIVGLKNTPPGMLKHIGRLHFRTSYGQNALKHCLEVGMFAGLIAAEVGANVEVARTAGFLHDIGKALSEESDKGHDYITKDILEEFKYPEEIIHAAWAHHEAEPAHSLEAKIIMAADALSASRPGARLESLERYLQRIKELEETAGAFPGIEKTFAISAGREVRIIVKPSKIHDDMMSGLAHNIVERIEKNLNYPGTIKVNVIRRNKWKAMAGGHEEEIHTTH